MWQKSKFLLAPGRFPNAVLSLLYQTGFVTGPFLIIFQDIPEGETMRAARSLQFLEKTQVLTVLLLYKMFSEINVKPTSLCCTNNNNNNNNNMFICQQHIKWQFLLVMLGNLYCITILHYICTIWGIVCCQLDSWDRVFNPVFTQGPSSVNT